MVTLENANGIYPEAQVAVKYPTMTGGPLPLPQNKELHGPKCQQCQGRLLYGGEGDQAFMFLQVPQGTLRFEISAHALAASSRIRVRVVLVGSCVHGKNFSPKDSHGLLYKCTHGGLSQRDCVCELTSDIVIPSTSASVG